MKLRSQHWFDSPDSPGMTALNIERYLNYCITREGPQSGKPILGIAQTGSDPSPCNRHHIELAKRGRDGVIAGGGNCIEFPVHPIQETGKRPAAAMGGLAGLKTGDRIRVELNKATAIVLVDQFDKGMVLKPAVKHQRIAKTKGIPRDNH